MFFVLPMLSVFVIYIAAAVLPAAFLLRYIYRKDKLEKEPPKLLVSLLLLGVAAALVSIALEHLGKNVLSLLLDESSSSYTILLAFLVISVVEEGTKLIFLKRRTWRNPNFNYRFDGIVYAVFISLGFAAFENVGYVAGYGLTVAVMRALLAVPGHMGFAVFMGLFYGRAKQYENIGNTRGRTVNLIAAYLSAVALHGFYDACAMIGTVWSMLLFIVFIIAMYIIVIRLVQRQSASDQPI